ncbi:MAG: patatin-like phospholipase family protein [Leptospiraceae bacterium]|nr:patatin-like phospholipase family protein [Leptospiraceae bacterium]
MLPSPSSPESNALIVEGGGMKGAFSGGVLACMSKYFPSNKFELVVGVSAGSCVSAFYIADEGDLTPQKITDIWKHELYGNRFISFFNPLTKLKTILDQNYLIDYIFKNKYKLNPHILEEKDKPNFYVVVSDLQNHIPRYIKATKENMFSLLKAATALPIATRGKHLFENFILGDGGNLDPIPIEAVIKAGYKNITVVLNHPLDYVTKPIGRITSRLAFYSNPGFARTLRHFHHRMFNRAKMILKNPPPNINLNIIAPGEFMPVKTVTTNIKKLQYTVNKGWQTAYANFSKKLIL